MPLDRSKIYKGMHIRSDEPLPGYTPKRRENLQAEYPEFSDSLAAAGPDSGPAFELQRAGIAELAARLEMVREQLRTIKTTKAKR